MTAVTLQGIRKVHPGGRVAVAGVDLEIAPGELFVLLGPSGCGKSTLLRMIAGLDEPTAGRVCFDGVPVEEPTKQRDIAFMFQSGALYPHLSVRDNLAFPLRMARCHRAEVDERVATMARMLGLSELLDRRPRRLSGGQQQRVAMGRSLIRRPGLLMMDEPMSNLDAHLRTELRSQIAKLHRRLGLTTIYVTHDQVEAMALADRIAVMRSGRVVQCGTPAELYDRPVDTFVAGFVGTPPMNLLVGEVVADGRRRVVRIGRRELAVAASVRPGPVIVGIRPEDIRLVVGGDLIAEVVHVEQLGYEDLLHLRVDALPLVWNEGSPTVVDGPAVVSARLDRGSAAGLDPWRPVELEVAEVHLFDPVDGRSIGVVPIEHRAAV